MNFDFLLFEFELIGRVFLAVILGMIIGYEREIKNKPAGLRTHIFICMGSCLFTISALYLFPSNIGGTIDTTRIVAGIVTGTAFLGAGSIIAQRGDIKGLTTAASLWIVSAIGLIIGLGNYLFPIFVTLIVFAILRLGILFDRKIKSNKNS